MCVNLVRVHYQPEGGSRMMYTVGTTAVTSATLPNLQCNTEYTIWIYARGGLNDATTWSTLRMIYLPARGSYMNSNLSYILLYFVPLYYHTPAPPTPTGVTAWFASTSSVRVAWQWTSSGPAPDCFNTTTVIYHPEGGSESSLQLSDPTATGATLTHLQCNTSYTITVVATAGVHRSKGLTSPPLQGIVSKCVVECDHIHGVKGSSSYTVYRYVANRCALDCVYCYMCFFQCKVSKNLLCL